MTDAQIADRIKASEAERDTLIAQANLQVAYMNGKIAALRELLGLPVGPPDAIVTEGEDAPAPSDRGPWIQPPEEMP